MPIDFSLILNSRGRPQLLKNLLRSAYGNAYNPQRIEFLIRLDKDDYATVDAFKRVHNFYPNVQILVGERINNVHSSINHLASLSIGKYIFVLNDDVEFQTLYWDKIISETTEQHLIDKDFKDRILYIGPFDNSVDKCGDKNYASFPLLTKEAYDTLGYFMLETFVGLGGDVSLYRIFNSIGRTLHLPDVKLNHIYHNTVEKVLNPDDTARNMRQNTYRNNVDAFTYNIEKDINKLLIGIINAQ